MEDTRANHYFGNAWRSLSTTRNLFGKLCLLALIQFVPILGQIVTFGYLLGWAREAAWNMETPLPPHVFGRDDSGFWSRGVRAFFIALLYALIESVLVALLIGGGAAIVYAFGLEGAAAAAVLIVSEVLSVLLMLLLLAFLCIGLVRMAIYDRFGAAFQWGVAWRMTFHRFGGLFKLFWTLVLAGIIFAVIETLLVIVLAPAFVGVGIGLPLVGTVLAYGEFTDAALALIAGVSGASLAVTVGSVVVLFFLAVITNMINALMWRAFGNWVARFDVAHWGASHDPLPYQTAAGERVGLPSNTVAQDGGAPAEAVDESAEQTAVQEQPSATPVAPTLEKRSNPLLNGFLAFLIALVVAMAASGVVAAVAAALYSEGVVQIDAEEALETLNDQARQLYSEMGDWFENDWFYAVD